MRRIGRINQKGLTTLEILIILGIFTVLFIIFWQAFSRYSNKESLIQGTNDFVSEINSLLNDVHEGVVASLGDDLTNVHCKEDGTTGEIQYVYDEDALAGDHDDCIFLGKVIHLGENENEGNPIKINEEVNNYSVHVLVGLRDYNRDKLIKVETVDGEVKEENSATVVRELSTYDNRPVPGAVGIKEAYYLITKDNPTIARKNYIDGIAIVFAKYGPSKDENNDFISGSRFISLIPVFTKEIINSDRGEVRDRLGKQGFVQKIKEHCNKNDVAEQSHPRYDGCPSGEDNLFFQKEDIEYPIYICLTSPADRALVRIGAIGGEIKAQADLTKENTDKYCSNDETVTLDSEQL